MLLFRGFDVDAASVAQNRKRDKQQSARRREQRLDRRRGQLGLRNEAKRRTARNEGPEIGAVEARRKDHVDGHLEP